MNVYKCTEDIVHQDQYGDPELEDRVNIYCFDDIIIYYSGRYNDWTTDNNYNLPITSEMTIIKPTSFEMQGFINAIFN